MRCNLFVVWTATLRIRADVPGRVAEAQARVLNYRSYSSLPRMT